MTNKIVCVTAGHSNTGKIDWLESLMCSLFSYGIYFALTWLNLPAELGVLIGGFLGFKGTNVISQWISKKLGLDA